MPPRRATAAAAEKKTETDIKGPSKVTKTVAKATTSKTQKTTAKTAKAAVTDTKTTKPKTTKSEVKPSATTKAAAAKPKAAAKAKTAAKTTKAAEPKKPEGRPPKRKQEEEDEDEESAAEGKTATKKRKTAADKPATNGTTATNKRKTADEAPARPAKKAKVAEKVIVNQPPPPTKLDVFVCGAGDSGELGLGTAKNAINVKRPRLNPNLAANTVGVVQVAAGGMHVVALTHDNKVLTWGVNDQGALGRDTTWEGGLKEMGAESDDSDSESGDDAGLNPRESTPTGIPQDKFPEGTIFTQVAAGDSCSFALTDEGLVYGWGTFRSIEGVFGFSTSGKHNVNLVQKDPMLVPGLSKIVQIACGANHVLALDVNGNAYAWGSGQQNQLGRRITERNKTEGLTPREFGGPLKKKVKYVACGADHSFAVDTKGNVWAWGINNFGETGIPDNAGESNAAVVKPTKVGSLAGKNIKVLNGGAHHSVGVTEDGECLVWGRLDGFQLGIKIDTLPINDPEQVKRSEGAEGKPGQPRILLVPTAVPNIDAVQATCGSDHTIAITRDGKAYSWGFNVNYQTGQGETDEDVEVATLIDNTAVRGKKLNWAGAGGQYSILTAPTQEAQVNGVNGTKA